MSRKETLLVSQHPFPDPDDYQRYLRGFEDEGHIITAIGEVFDVSKPEDRANCYEYDLPANLEPPASSALQVKVVPAAATADQNEYKAFLSPFLDAFELVDRAKVFIGGKDMEVVLLRPIGAKPTTPSAGLGGAGMGAPGGLGGGGRGKVSPGALKARLEQIVSASPLVGFVPSDGPRYGITTGAAHEWAQMFTDLAKVESGFDPRDKVHPSHMINCTIRTPMQGQL
jgi:hypothetical protein